MLFDGTSASGYIAAAGVGRSELKISTAISTLPSNCLRRISTYLQESLTWIIHEERRVQGFDPCQSGKSAAFLRSAIPAGAHKQETPRIPQICTDIQEWRAHPHKGILGTPPARGTIRNCIRFFRPIGFIDADSSIGWNVPDFRIGLTRRNAGT
jgi:hypothetical protein